ncbi:MAG: RNA 3'-terminal phosphate cyclase [archaeon]
MIKINGSFGEGGGAILRQALALSVVTGKPCEIENIRSNRPTPGLKAQHMNSIIALEKLTDSSVTNCEIGSEKITFIPREVMGRTIQIDIGTAGSITLLLQSLILPSILSGKNITINLTGGTDVKWSQPIDYFVHVFVPIIKKYADIEVRTMKRGYYPKGSGKVIVKINSKQAGLERKPLDLTKRGKLLQIRGISHASSDLFERSVADRQADNAEVLLSGLGVSVRVERQYSNTESTGSGITLWAMFSRDEEDGQPIFLGSDSLGEKTKKSEEVGREAVDALKKEIDSGAVVDKYLADQLIPLLAITKGEIKTSEITKHTLSNIYVAEKFLDVKFEIDGNIIRAS